MGGGREADDQDARLGVAEAGDGAAPVLLAGVRRALLPRDLLAPRDQPGAGTALRDLLPQLVEGLAQGVACENPDDPVPLDTVSCTLSFAAS